MRATLPFLCVLVHQIFAITGSHNVAQDHKVYVQHIIPLHARHLAAAISSGASVIVCGAAQQMPKAVFAALAEALATGLNTSVEDAEEVLKGVPVACCLGMMRRLMRIARHGAIAALLARHMVVN
jgi:hypothetical protein